MNVGRQSLVILFVTLIAASTPVWSQDPIWVLGRERLDTSMIEGDVSPVEEQVRVDGENTFAVASNVLGEQTNYTVEFDVKRPVETHTGHAVVLLSNSDPESQSGFSLIYHPPPYNAAWLMCNGHRTMEQRGFLDKDFNKVTLVVKDGRMSVFRNGLVLAVTDQVKNSYAPLRFGGAFRDQTKPQSYTIRDAKVYDHAVFPTGFDETIKRMRNCSGEHYMIQRAEMEDDALPRILVVGDSISMGYRGFISEHFEGEAYVDYWVSSGVEWYGKDINAEGSDAAAAWRGVLSHGPYDVITWNAMTLHWWNDQHETRCPIETLARNIGDASDVVRRLAPATELIWIRCTPIRSNLKDGTPTLENADHARITRYNAIVDGVMHERAIPVVDLTPIAISQMHRISRGASDTLHWPRDTSRLFAEHIVQTIERSLKNRLRTQGTN
ncbi:SGNH/GDSL hydrolase family protein [Rhodopirellula sp. SWK7]|uniref:SGNH/GDSL hydrolase family protein n=1 Tax=Rhodopirellula sp. SWK7 TaxID=595460 RepID=UPI0002BD66A4|nr:SGNH/GDSL hydrolase family protein [Rhodopirellula sp. SWK7]EMI42339.1 putative secreted protein [Rhodopirellula sp. SWK7]